MINIVSCDTSLYRKEDIVMYLYSCMQNNKSPIINYGLEGPCSTANGLYALLDNFCQTNNYNKSNITIKTANLIEFHDEYNIVKNINQWPELKLFPNWMRNNKVPYNPTPKYHFGHFVGRSSWDRLWVGSHLFKYHNKKTLQSFHSHLSCNYVISEKDGIHDNLGLDDINQSGFADWEILVEFLKKCPIEIDHNELNQYDGKTEYFIKPSNKNIYPIQHPANINMAKVYYPQICVDVVSETRIIGNLFYLTEKTWRPIISKKPFLLDSSYLSLSNLQKLGFKTFSDFWPEYYDEYEGADRIKEICNIIDILANFSIDEMHELLKKMQPILEHNYKTLSDLTTDKLEKVFGN